MNSADDRAYERMYPRQAKNKEAMSATYLVCQQRTPRSWVEVHQHIYGTGSDENPGCLKCREYVARQVTYTNLYHANAEDRRRYATVEVPVNFIAEYPEMEDDISTLVGVFYMCVGYGWVPDSDNLFYMHDCVLGFDEHGKFNVPWAHAYYLRQIEYQRGYSVTTA